MTTREGDRNGRWGIGALNRSKDGRMLRALRGEPVAGPRRYRLAAAAFMAFIADLIADLL